MYLWIKIEIFCGGVWTTIHMHIQKPPRAHGEKDLKKGVNQISQFIHRIDKKTQRTFFQYFKIPFNPLFLSIIILESLS